MNEQMNEIYNKVIKSRKRNNLLIYLNEYVPETQLTWRFGNYQSWFLEEICFVL